MEWTRNETKVIFFCPENGWRDVGSSFYQWMYLESKTFWWEMMKIIWWTYHLHKQEHTQNNPCDYSHCKMIVFEEKGLLSEPFVEEHVDVNVDLPQMFTELLLNKYFVPYLYLLLVLEYFGVWSNVANWFQWKVVKT